MVAPRFRRTRPRCPAVQEQSRFIPGGISVPSGKITGRIYFGTKKSDLDPQDTVVLDKLIDHYRTMLSKGSAVNLYFAGRADERDEPGLNQRLGSSRASAVRQYVDDRLAGSAKYSSGLGTTGADFSDDCWSHDRRVDVYERYKAGLKCDAGILTAAEAAIARSKIPTREKCKALLRLLKAANTDDRVLDLNSYLGSNQPPAKVCLEPDLWAAKMRAALIQALCQPPQNDQWFVDCVKQAYQKIFDAWQWANRREATTGLGGGSGLNAAQKKAHAWISARIRDPLSVYSVVAK